MNKIVLFFLLLTACLNMSSFTKVDSTLVTQAVENYSLDFGDSGIPDFVKS